MPDNLFLKKENSIGGRNTAGNLDDIMKPLIMNYFWRLQRSNCSPGFPKQTADSGDYLDFERYEQLKQERDAMWKNCIEKLRTEKDDIIQQLKLEKVEVFSAFSCAFYS